MEHSQKYKLIIDFSFTESLDANDGFNRWVCVVHILGEVGDRLAEAVGCGPKKSDAKRNAAQAAIGQLLSGCPGEDSHQAEAGQEREAATADADTTMASEDFEPLPEDDTSDEEDHVHLRGGRYFDPMVCPRGISSDVDVEADQDKHSGATEEQRQEQIMSGGWGMPVTERVSSSVDLGKRGWEEAKADVPRGGWGGGGWAAMGKDDGAWGAGSTKGWG
eukprot:1689001-Rhodomonas_salina.3